MYEKNVHFWIFMLAMGLKNVSFPLTCAPLQTFSGPILADLSYPLDLSPTSVLADLSGTVSWGEGRKDIFTNPKVHRNV